MIDDVRAAFDAYEAALRVNDVDALNAAFWPDARAVRHGLEGSQYGYDEIAAWRRDAPPVPPGRSLRNTTFEVFGEVVSVETEFAYDGSPVVGRQSQLWMRCADRWVIARAHVSLLELSGSSK